jgi:hypothetical protein
MPCRGRRPSAMMPRRRSRSRPSRTVAPPRVVVRLFVGLCLFGCLVACLFVFVFVCLFVFVFVCVCVCLFGCVCLCLVVVSPPGGFTLRWSVGISLGCAQCPACSKSETFCRHGRRRYLPPARARSTVPEYPYPFSARRTACSAARGHAPRFAGLSTKRAPFVRLFAEGCRRLRSTSSGSARAGSRSR